MSVSAIHTRTSYFPYRRPSGEKKTKVENPVRLKIRKYERSSTERVQKSPLTTIEMKVELKLKILKNK